NICPGPWAKTMRSLGEFRLDAVQKLPVRLQDLLRARDQRGAVGAVEALGDERATCLRVLDVEVLVQVEVRRGGLAVDAIALAPGVQLCEAVHWRFPSSATGGAMLPCRPCAPPSGRSLGRCSRAASTG